MTEQWRNISASRNLPAAAFRDRDRLKPPSQENREATPEPHRIRGWWHRRSIRKAAVHASQNQNGKRHENCSNHRTQGKTPQPGLHRIFCMLFHKMILFFNFKGYNLHRKSNNSTQRSNKSGKYSVRVCWSGVYNLSKECSEKLNNFQHVDNPFFINRTSTNSPQKTNMWKWAQNKKLWTFKQPLLLKIHK